MIIVIGGKPTEGNRGNMSIANEIEIRDALSALGYEFTITDEEEYLETLKDSYEIEAIAKA